VFEKEKSDTHYHNHIYTYRPKDTNIRLKKFKQTLELYWKKLSSAGFINNFQPIM